MFKLFIDASPLVDPNPSGIGHLVASLTIALHQKAVKTNQFLVVLVVPRKNIERLSRWPELDLVPRKVLPFRTRILNGLIKFNLLPPMDLFIGRGVYLFGNYRNWPLTSFSRSLTFIHDISFALFPDFSEPRNQKMLTKDMPKFIKRTDHILTISEASKNEVSKHYHLKKSVVDVVYCGVDTKIYRPYSDAIIDEVREKFGIQKDYLLYVGNIEPRKNLQILVEAFAKLPSELVNKVDLFVVGSDGWQNEGILNAIERARASGYSIIRPTQFVTDREVGILMSGARALVQPSVHEGFSLPPLESVAAGMRPIVSDIAVHHEILGNAATYFNSSSSSDLVKKLKKVLATESKMSRDESSRITDKYSWNIAAEELMKVVYGLLEKSRKSQIVTRGER